MGSIGLIIILAFAAMTAIAATVLSYIFIKPEHKAAKMPKFIRVIRDILEMKELYLEKVLKALYIVSTLFCVIAGVLLLFNVYVPYVHDGVPEIRWNGGYGLLLMVVGPIVLRLIYEGLLMFVLLVKNTMQINKKLKAEESEEKPAEPAPEKPGVVIVQSHE